MNKVPFFLPVAFSLALMCCNRHKNWKGGLIKEFGQYPLENGSVLEVSSSKGILRYSLRDKKGAIIFESKDSISIYQKWAIFCDDRNNIWAKSADIGTFCWEYISDSLYKEVDVYPTSDKWKSVPSELIDRK